MSSGMPSRASPSIIAESIARETPFPPNAVKPSRLSTASCVPVDAPESTVKKKGFPSLRIKPTETVGLLRESKACTATIFLIFMSASFTTIPITGIFTVKMRKKPPPLRAIQAAARKNARAHHFSSAGN
ncbi:MAG: hypothetical protein NT051_03920 [Candidatus Micrarchaeota archaeon]|nr:hypothetical protein [Candidatus Micrarchaeota archaeon]